MADGSQKKIFVGGLSPETTKETLDAYFQQFGAADSYVMKDGQTGRSRGFGFVNFTEEGVMEKILEYQHQIDGVIVNVSPYGYDNSKRGAHAAGGGVAGALGGSDNAAVVGSNQLKLFVGGLSQESTRDSLNAYFAQFGPVDCYVMKDGATGRSRGFAFANFQDDATMNAVLSFQDHIVDNVKVTVSPYGYKGPGTPRGGKGGHSPAPAVGGVAGLPMDIARLLEQAVSAVSAVTAVSAPQQAVAANDSTSLSKIFVGGLSQATTRESLTLYFSQFGDCDGYVMKDGQTGRSRGFGFVNFSDVELKNQVLQVQHEIDGVIVSCKSYEGRPAAGGAAIAPVRRAPAAAQTPAQALATALQMLTKSTLGKVSPNLGSAIGVAPAAAPAAAAPMTVRQDKLFVANLSPNTTDESLTEAFAMYSPLQCKVCADRQGRSKGFGIVEFESAALAQVAMSAPVVVDGSQVEISEWWEKPKGAGKGRPSPY